MDVFVSCLEIPLILLVNAKFVPVSFPIEKKKKKNGQTSLSKSSMLSQDPKKRPQSMPQTLPQSMQQSIHQSRILSLAQSMPISQNTSGYNLTFNLAELAQPEKKGNRSQQQYNYDPSYGEETFKSSLVQSGGLIEKVMGSPEKTKVKKKLKLQKKSVPKKDPRKTKQKSSSIEREQEMGNLSGAKVSINQSVKDESVTKRGNRERSGESIKTYFLKEFNLIEKPKSGKTSKSTSPIKVEAVPKKGQRKVKSREQVSKSEIPPALEEMIKRNAQEYIGIHFY